ncbi:uncharacterized protein LOC133791385 [Humulus lupulus]|uniref:uncharacterized protein LOC133791385 n=1 Tax=Humulus lupulus TaxID=3486 RepID=UPI002B40202A|nr:uncharacterized protein LOC133791385 [Humulus lupulus]
MEVVVGGFSNLTLESNLLEEIKEGQESDPHLTEVKAEVKEEKVKNFNVSDSGILKFNGRVCVPAREDIKNKIMNEAHNTPYTIAMDFVIGLPRTSKGYDLIWVIIDRLTKSAHFLPFWQSLHKAIGTRLKFSTTFHPQIDGQTERTIQTLEDMLRACVLDFEGSWSKYLPLIEFSYNNSYQETIVMAPYEALYGRKCRSHIHWHEFSERKYIEQQTGPDIVTSTTEVVRKIQQRIAAAQS